MQNAQDTRKVPVFIISAIDQNGGIGRNNKLLCELPRDMMRFKFATIGNVVVMGRETYDSLPNKPLSDRYNIIVTKKQYYSGDKVVTVRSLEQAMQVAQQIVDHDPTVSNIYIAGGAAIYQQAIDLADKLIVTKIEEQFEADRFFPEIDSDKWELILDHPTQDGEYETRQLIYQSCKPSP